MAFVILGEESHIRRAGGRRGRGGEPPVGLVAMQLLS